MFRSTWRIIALMSLLLVAALLSQPAFATVSVSRAEVSGARLRIEGTAIANRDITVDGAVLGRSDGSGSFRIERDGFTSPADCTVDVNDGSASPTNVRLSGCTVSSPTPSPTPPPPTTGGLQIVTASPLPTANVGTQYTAFIEASGGEGRPIRWRLVSGSVPDGLRFVGDDFRLSQTTGVVGTPRTEQTRSFTVQGQDPAGNTARKAFSITVGPPLPLQITNGGDVLAPGTVGRSYANSLFASGGVQPYRWAIVAGALPPGLALSGNTISGTPTAAGSFTFTARVTDDRGATASRQFTINVSPSG
jgi:hypothetical protein